jgi:hypothetical protein
MASEHSINSALKTLRRHYPGGGAFWFRGGMIYFKYMENDMTVRELAEILTHFAENIDQRFDKVDQRLDRMDQRMDRVENTMVTKAYLDDRHFDKEGDLVAAVKTGDQKVNAVVAKLEEKKVFSTPEAQTLSTMAPFAA